MMCQGRFIDLNRVPLCFCALMEGKAVCMWEKASFLLSFFVNVKMPSKSMFLNQIELKIRFYKYRYRLSDKSLN